MIVPAIILYFVLKTAIRKGIVEAHNEIERMGGKGILMRTSAGEERREQ